jgi:hypothetical protein
MSYDQVAGTAVSSTLRFGNGATTVHTLDQGELTLIQHGTSGQTTSMPMIWTAGGLLLQRGADSFGYDGLGRLTSASTVGLYGEVHSQSFVYDAWGNRTQSLVATTGSGVVPAESLSWTAAYGGDNHLPGTVHAPGGDLLTGALYDDFGRLQQIWAIPGQSDSQTAWIYDSSGRITAENGVSFLLDAEGLRFRRTKPDGSIQYTVYGFSRDPLSTFETVLATLTQSGTASMVGQPAASTASTAAPTLQKRRAQKTAPLPVVGTPYGKMKAPPARVLTPERRANPAMHPAKSSETKKVQMPTVMMASRARSAASVH